MAGIAKTAAMAATPALAMGSIVADAIGGKDRSKPDRPSIPDEDQQRIKRQKQLTQERDGGRLASLFTKNTLG